MNSLKQQKENPPRNANSIGDDKNLNVSTSTHITTGINIPQSYNSFKSFDIHMLKGVKGNNGKYTAKCPAHDDRVNSLSITVANGKTLLHCHAGCSTESVLASLGLPMTALFEERPTPKAVKPQVIRETTYPYFYTDGTLAYNKKRLDYSNGTKRFAFFKPDGSKGVEGIQRVPYNLRAVLSAHTVYFVEGEKCVHAIDKAGRVATSLDAGANSKWLPEYADYFKGKNVIIIPDNDTAGMKYARTISAQIPDSKIVYLPGLNDKGDIYDWLTAGHSIDELDNLPGEELKADDDTNKDPDFIRVDYNPNYVIVTYSEDKVKKTCTKSLYIEMGSPGEYKGEIPQDVDENLTPLLAHYGLELKFNVLKNRIEVYKNGILLDRLEWLISRILDKCKVQNYKVSQARLEGQLAYNARNRGKYNPIEDYLENCYKQYDNKDYIAELCKTIESSIDDTKKRMYIERFLLQMVWVACSDEKDTKHHGEFCLTLQGKQGQGKTSWLRNLLPEYLRGEYFLDSRAMDLSKKDDILEQATVWLCEMGEIAATFRKTDQEVLKGYITAAIDKVRPPYGKEAIEKKRRMCLCATTNDAEFLRDRTGDRRFAVIPCTKINQFHDIDLTKLWAQVYHEFKQGNDRYYFDKKEIEVLFKDNSLYRVKTDLELALLEVFELFPEEDETSWAGDWYKASKIKDKMSIVGLDVRTYSLRSITQTLKEIGCKWRDYAHTIEFFIKQI